MDKFILHSPFKTVDEQNRSVDALVKGVETGARPRFFWESQEAARHSLLPT